MNLSCYIGYIQSQEKSNSASLRMLLRLWSSAKPESYNVKSLKRVLAAEVMISCAADLPLMDGSKTNIIYTIRNNGKYIFLDNLMQYKSAATPLPT